MPIDFDDSDIADVIEETEQIAQTPQPRGGRHQEEPQDINQQMDEVEKRLVMAQYYRLILNDTLFGEADNQEVAELVEGEIREFVRERMAVLVGVGEVKKQPVFPFSDAEVQSLRTLGQPDVSGALKALAAKVLKKPTILDAKPLAPVQPKPEPKVFREPTLKKINKPASKAPAAPVVQSRPVPTAVPKAGRGKKQEKVFKKVTNDAGESVIMDLTPQAQPAPNSVIRPHATPVGVAQVQQMAESQARLQAGVAMNELENQLLNSNRRR